LKTQSTYHASGARLLLFDKQRLAFLHHLFAELGLVQHHTQQPPLIGDRHLVSLLGVLQRALVRGRVMLGVGALLMLQRRVQQRLLLETERAHKVIGAAKVLGVLLVLVAALVVEHDGERVLELWERERGGRDTEGGNEWR
jgi:hypothetical protein